MEQNKEYTQFGLKLLFVIFLLWFSVKSFVKFYQGEITFEISKEKYRDLRYPSVTLCPSEPGALAPLKIAELEKNIGDNNNTRLTDKMIFSYLLNIDNPIEIIRNFSFSRKEVEIDGAFLWVLTSFRIDADILLRTLRSSKYVARTELVNEEQYKGRHKK